MKLISNCCDNVGIADAAVGRDVGVLITTYPPDPELAVCTDGEGRLAESCTLQLCRLVPRGVDDRAEPIGVPVLELTGERERPTTVVIPPESQTKGIAFACPRGGVEIF